MYRLRYAPPMAGIFRELGGSTVNTAELVSPPQVLGGVRFADWRRRNRTALWITSIGALLRFGWVASAARMPKGLADPMLYHDFATKIASGAGYRNLSGDLTAYYPPGYPYFLGFLYKVASVLSIDNLALWVGFVQAALGAFSVWMIFRLGEFIGGRRVAIGASLTLALWPNLILSSSTFLSETLFLAALITSMWSASLILQWARASAAADGSTVRSVMRVYWHAPAKMLMLCLCGTTFGLAALVRPQALAVPVLIAVGAIGTSVKRRWVQRGSTEPTSATQHQLLRNTIAFGLISLTMMGGWLTVSTPWILRNFDVFGEFVPLSNNAGDNLCIGFQPGARGYFEIPPICDDPPLYRGGPSAELERSRRNTEVAMDGMTENPGRLPLLSARKLLQTMANDHDGLRAVESFGDDPFLASPVRKFLEVSSDVYFYVVLGLAILGGLSVIRRRVANVVSVGTPTGAGVIYWSYLIAGVAVPVLTFAEPRFKAGMIPCLALSVGFALVFPDRASRRDLDEERAEPEGDGDGLRASADQPDTLVSVRRAWLVAVGLVGLLVTGVAARIVIGSHSVGGEGAATLLAARELWTGSIPAHGLVQRGLSGQALTYQPGSLPYVALMGASWERSGLFALLSVLLVHAVCAFGALAMVRKYVGWAASIVIAVIALVWFLAPVSLVTVASVGLLAGPLLLFWSCCLVLWSASRPPAWVAVVAVLSGSWVAQAHFSGLWAMCVGGVATAIGVWGRSHARPDWSNRSWVAILVTVVACWFPLFLHSMSGVGNLATAINANGEPKLGLVRGAAVVANRLVSLAGVWGVDPNSRQLLGVERVDAWITVALMLGAIWLWRRASGLAAHVAAVSVVGFAAASLSTANLPSGFEFASRTNFLVSDATAIVAAGLLVFAIGLFASRGGARFGNLLVQASVGLSVLLAALSLPHAVETPHDHWRALAAESLAAQIGDIAHQRDASVVVIRTSGNGYGFWSPTEEVVRELRSNGIDARPFDYVESLPESLGIAGLDSSKLLQLTVVLGADRPVKRELAAYRPDVIQLRSDLVAELSESIRSSGLERSGLSQVSEERLVSISFDPASMTDEELTRFHDDFVNPRLRDDTRRNIDEFAARIAASSAVIEDKFVESTS